MKTKSQTFDGYLSALPDNQRTALEQLRKIIRSAAPNAEDTPVPRGSRRRRLWELPSQALCPVIGVCLPMPVLRRKLGKLLGGQALSNDYEMHCGAINECARRGPVSEMLQKELDQRFAIALRQSSQHKTAEALTRWWHAAQQGNDVGGALWGALTHARCDAALQEQILRDIHMLQHQVGAANRADLQRLDELQDEHAVLTRELAQAQSRSTRLLAERARELEASQAECLRLRGELMARDTLAAGLREELQQLEDVGPRVAASITSFLKQPANRKLLDELRDLGVLVPGAAEPRRDASFAGQNFVITGTLGGMTRHEAQAEIESRGGRVSGSVSKKTDFVVVGADPGSKLDKAKELGRPILSEAEFVRMLHGGERGHGR